MKKRPESIGTGSDTAEDLPPEVTGAVVADPRMTQIRELMFGSASRDLDRRIKDVSSRLDDEVGRLSSMFERRLSGVEAQFSPILERLAVDIRDESDARATAVSDSEARLTQALRVQRDELQQQVRRLVEALGDADARHLDAVATLEGLLQDASRAGRQVVDTVRHELQADKVAREDLADMLTELAVRLRKDVSDPASG